MILSAINPFEIIFNNYNNQKNSNKNQIKNTQENEENLPFKTVEKKDAILQPKIKKIFHSKIDFILYSMNYILNLIGPFFSITIFYFIIFTYLMLLKTIIPYYSKKNKFLTNLLNLIFLIEIFYSLFNFILATIIKPGSIIDLKSSEFYKKNNAYVSKYLKFPKINQNIQIKFKICKQCNEIKPLRTHHCTICNKCIFKMDHHCPWINNCVGQNNQRYFLLFIFHTFIYSFLVGIFSFPIFFTLKNNKNNVVINNLEFICILSGISFSTLLFFNSWNWFLAIKGKTTLEFWKDKINNNEIDYDFGSIKKNLFYIFGEKNLFKIIFIPNIKKLPFSGLEWSRKIDENFFIEGIENFEPINNKNIENETNNKIMISNNIINKNKNFKEDEKNISAKEDEDFDFN